MASPAFGIHIDDLYYYPKDRTFRFRSLLGPPGAMDVIKKYGDLMIHGRRKDVVFMYRNSETVSGRKFYVYKGEVWSDAENDVYTLNTFHLVVEIG